jgi:hypothetical protein
MVDAKVRARTMRNSTTWKRLLKRRRIRLVCGVLSSRRIDYGNGTLTSAIVADWLETFGNGYEENEVQTVL